MKILIVNTLDTFGGAARAAYRLHVSLREQDVDSTMLVQFKSGDDSHVVTTRTGVWRVLDRVRPLLDALPVFLYWHKTPTQFSPAWVPWSNVVAKIAEIDPDIVHIHWFCGGMMRVEDLAKIKVPIVWTLHDNWVFTGGCHIMWECQKYLTVCGACPRLCSQTKNDLSKKIFERKKRIYAQIDNLTIVGPSKWITKCAAKSALLKDRRCVNLPNPLDTNKFQSVERSHARDMLDLSKDKKIILFGAVNATHDINKGFKELRAALKKINKDDVELAVFGGCDDGDQFGFTTHYLGHISDDAKLVMLYNAADVMIVPSLQEAFGQTASESMACGTPVVAFAHTGLLDIVDHKKNGYLAQPFDTDDLARGIEWVLHHENYDELCKNARKKIVSTFDAKIVAKKYIALYHDILSKKN